MKLSVGIVGLPNVGKSTLFQALTKKPVDIANYPFTTIDPNVGVVEVPDERLQKIASVMHSEKVIPAAVEFVDIAGLVKGAHEGQGLGNQFLSHIRDVAAIVHVVRCFEDGDIVHVEQTLDPVRDIDIVQTELSFKDIKKPTIYLLNSDKREVPQALQKKLDAMGAHFVIANLKEELDAQELSEGERKELGIELYLPELIKRTYELLNLITFFSILSDETRAWAIVQGTKAPQAGGVIHTDFEQRFIRAEVIQWDKLVEAGTWQQAAAKGWLGQEGKEYVVQDGDVIEIKHG